jgi:hypothetical protein
MISDVNDFEVISKSPNRHDIADDDMLESIYIDEVEGRNNCTTVVYISADKTECRLVIINQCLFVIYS